MKLQDFNNVKLFKERYKHLTYAAEQISIKGYNLEFGVFRGGTTNHIAKSIKDTIYGFDSFKGLPEDWIVNPERTATMDRFKMSGLPTVASNVKLVIGWYKDSIPSWKKTHKDQIAFIHVDSDIYSSAKTIFTELNSQIVPGTIIVFDELLDKMKDNAAPRTYYPNWKQGEWKALNEWLKEFDRECEVVSRSRHFQATIRVTK
jgi:hypothetical protein